MKCNSIIKVLCVCVFLGLISCEEEIDTTAIMDQLGKLPQNKIAEKRANTLREMGIEVSLDFELANSPLFSKDRSDGILIYYIREDLDSVENTLFTIRYNVKTNKVISVESNPELIKE